MKVYDSAFAETILALAYENKKQSKRLFIAVIVLIGVIVAMIAGFFVWLSSVELDELTTTTESTTITQNTEEGSGNNVYQSGEYATYSDRR